MGVGRGHARAEWPQIAWGSKAVGRAAKVDALE